MSQIRLLDFWSEHLERGSCHSLKWGRLQVEQFWGLWKDQEGHFRHEKQQSRKNTVRRVTGCWVNSLFLGKRVIVVPNADRAGEIKLRVDHWA